MLEGECEALLVEKFVVELVKGGLGAQEESVVVGVLVLMWLGASFGFDEGNFFDVEEEERDAFEVVG